MPVGETELYMKYLGVLILLGKVSHHFSAIDQYSVARAFQDANEILEGRKASVRFEKDHRGGWVAFDHVEPKGEKSEK